MGLFKKEEKTHFVRDEEGRVVETVHEEPTRSRISFRRDPKPLLPKEDKPLTREEQFKPRVQPWKTERGKRVVKGVKVGVKRIDKKIVDYNRKSNLMRPGVGFSPSRSSPAHDNYNPFGSMFDTGMSKPPKKKKSSKTKYTVIGGRAFPIAGTGKKKSKKKKSSSRSSMGDPFSGKYWGY